MKKRLLSAVMASAMVLSLAACGGAKTETTAAETTAEKKEETTTADTTAAETAAEAAGGTLIVGFDQDFPPMGFVGDNGEYTGFDLDLAKEVASRLGLEYKALLFSPLTRVVRMRFLILLTSSIRIGLSMTTSM